MKIRRCKVCRNMSSAFKIFIKDNAELIICDKCYEIITKDKD